MSITLPENFAIERMRNYNSHYNSRIAIPATTKFRVLADTGWYNSTTNLDAEPDMNGTMRYQVVLVPGEKDPIVISDSFGAAQHGGSFSLSGGYSPAKDKTPFLQHSRYVLSFSASTGFESFLNGKKKSQYLHPRFTALKAWMREIVRIEKKRNEFIRKAREKAIAEAAKTFPYVIDKLTGETLAKETP